MGGFLDVRISNSIGYGAPVTAARRLHRAGARTTAPHLGQRRPQSAGVCALAIFASLASALTGLFIFTPALVAHADTAQRTSWNASSNQMYRLEGNNGMSWIAMDPSKLTLSISPAVDSYAVLSASADVESSTTENTDVGISVGGGAPLAWKEGGEYTGSKPDPVYTQVPTIMDTGHTYTVEVVWKARSAEGLGQWLIAGDGDGSLFATTTLNALLTPVSANLVSSKVASPSTSYSTTTPSNAWQLMSMSSLDDTFATPAGPGNYSALMTASADLYSSSSAYTNANLGICLSAAGGTINSACSAAGDIILGSQTSGSVSGSMPIASLAEDTQTLLPSSTYMAGILWEAATNNTIYAGLVSSPTSLIVQLTPVSDSEQATTSTGSTTRPWASGDTGVTWEQIGTDSYTITPSANVLTYLTGNATLAETTGSYHTDFGICVTTGSGLCTTPSNIAAWTETGVWTGSPTAAYLQIPVFMTSGVTYTVSLVWKSDNPMASGNTMSAGQTTPAEVSTLTSLQVPYSAPSAPPSVSATAGNGQATVNWTASTLSPGSPLTGYAVTPYLETTANGVAANVALETMDVPLGTSFIVPNLANGQTYLFAVAGLNGEGAGATGLSGAVTPGLPAAPTAVTIGSRGNGFENLSWTAPSSTGASAITGYVITPYIAGVAQAATTLSGTATSTTITGLMDGTGYTFGVAAINVFGTGVVGTSGSNNPYTTIPGAPSGVTGAAGNGQATISWTAPANNGGTAITGYTITPYIGGTAQSTTSATASSATVTGLTNGTTYTFTVAAVNSVGTGAASANSWGVIPATTPVVPSMTMSVDKGTSATYAIGTAVTYTATISSNAGVATTASFSDVLPQGVNGAGGAILINGSACSGGTTCTASATGVSVSGVTIPATGNVVMTYALTVIGSLSSCAIEADTAAVTMASGNSIGASAPFTACDSDLGANAWNSFIAQTLGDGGSAGVNPANGNLVVTQTDSIPMQLHGGLTFDLTRTYNSQDTDLAGVPNIVGAGWVVSFVAAGTDPGGVALIVPSAASTANPTPITMVDGSGARYVFTASALSSVINVGSLYDWTAGDGDPQQLAEDDWLQPALYRRGVQPAGGRTCVHVALHRDHWHMRDARNIHEPDHRLRDDGCGSDPP